MRSGYLRAAREAHKRPLGRLRFLLGPKEDDTGSSFEDVLGIDVLSAQDHNPVREVYLWIKQKPEFQGAVDV